MVGPHVRLLHREQIVARRASLALCVKMPVRLPSLFDRSNHRAEPATATFAHTHDVAYAVAASFCYVTLCCESMRARRRPEADANPKCMQTDSILVAMREL